MSEALVEGRDGVVVGSASDAPSIYARVATARKYDPDGEAYAPDPKNDKYAELTRLVEASSIALDVTVTTRDGLRETIRLNEADTRTWLQGSVEARFAIGNRKIREQHVQIAVTAARRHLDGPMVLTPIEESCLREVGALEDVKVLREGSGGGYADAVQLTERARDLVAHTPVEMALREDFFDEPLTGTAAYGAQVAPTQREFLPRGGPAMEQQLLSDWWSTLAKCRYAYVQDPIVRHGCHILADFVTGRGVEVIAKHPAVQRIIDEFMAREKINDVIHPFAVSLSRDGNVFTRLFRIGNGRMSIGELHPATIWEQLTDAEDIRKIYLFVQRYQTRSQLFTSILNLPVVRWIERNIPADEMIHTKVNASPWDVLGHSDIYPALGWAKRLRDFLDATVQKEQSAAAYQWHYKTKGGNADVQRITAAISGPPAPPGSSFVTNEGVDVAAVASGTNATSKEGSTYEALINHIAVAFGLSKDYFGAASHNTRANALIATEPAAKRFEQRQGVITSYLERLLRAVVAEAKKYGLLRAQAGEDANIDETFRVVFPTIITADSGTRIDLLRKGVGMGAISHKRFSQEYAGEMELDDYDYDAEVEQIEEEIGVDPATMIMDDVAPVKRGMPDASDVAFDPKLVPNPADAGGAGGASKDENPTAGNGATYEPTSSDGRAAAKRNQGRDDRRGMESASKDALDAAARILSESGALVIRP
jgi:hypothetical protein